MNISILTQCGVSAARSNFEMFESQPRPGMIAHNNLPTSSMLIHLLLIFTVFDHYLSLHNARLWGMGVAKRTRI
jgi:hypothetical protein